MNEKKYGYLVYKENKARKTSLTLESAKQYCMDIRDEEIVARKKSTRKFPNTDIAWVEKEMDKVFIGYFISWEFDPYNPYDDNESANLTIMEFKIERIEME